jgi:hypothetical protein
MMKNNIVFLLYFFSTKKVNLVNKKILKYKKKLLPLFSESPLVKKINLVNFLGPNPHPIRILKKKQRCFPEISLLV